MSIDYEKVEALRQKLIYHLAIANHCGMDEDRRGVRVHLRGALSTLDELEIETSMEKIMGGSREGSAAQTA